MTKFIKIMLLGLLGAWLVSCSAPQPYCPPMSSVEPESGVVGTGITSECN